MRLMLEQALCEDTQLWERTSAFQSAEFTTVTSSRSWTSESSGSGGAEAPPGLMEALADVGLSAYTSAALRWCQETGAAFVGEVLDELEQLCAVLGPPGSQGV